MLAKPWLLGLSVLVTIAAVLLLLHNPKVGELFHAHVRDRPKRRLLLAAIGFFVTFAVARAMAYAAHRNAGPFHYVYIGGTHIHHLVWGILLLLMVGFCWLIEVGTGASSSSLLDLASIDAVILFGAALLIGIWGRDFLRAVGLELWSSRRRHR